MLKPVGNSQSVSKASMPSVGLPVLSKDSLDFLESANYVNRTKRYVVRIGELPEGGSPLVFPEGAEKSGETIKALDDGTPERGIVFWNGKDRTWQAVRGNGKETILITDVDSDQARLLSKRELELLGDLKNHSLVSATSLLSYAINELGLIDMQNKKLTAVEKEMAPIPGASPNYQQVTKDVLHKALFVPKGFIFNDGPVEQVYPEGAVLLTDDKYVWGIDKNVFIRNFKRFEDDKEVSLISLKEEFSLK